MLRPLAALTAALALGCPAAAWAHHSPGHAGTEALRTLATTGSDPAPRQRVAVVTEIARTTSEPTLNPSTNAAVSVLGSFQLTPRLYLGAQAPFILVDQDAADQPTQVGYGDTRFTSQLALGSLADKSQTWTLGLNLSVPTRTVYYQVDPGKQWTVSPLVAFTLASSKLRFFTMLLTPLESRPAGTAVDVSASLGLAYQILPTLSLAASVSADVRVLNYCVTPSGGAFCPEGRASELGRELGAVRAYAGLTAWWGISRHWAVFAGGQLPFTPKSDFAIAANLGLEYRF